MRPLLEEQTEAEPSATSPSASSTSRSIRSLHKDHKLVNKTDTHTHLSNDIQYYIQ